MTRDEVIALAREAGLFVPQAGIPENGALTRFAALVAAREREVCAKECENNIVDREGSEDYDQACVDCAYCIRILGDEKDE